MPLVRKNPSVRFQDNRVIHKAGAIVDKGEGVFARLQDGGGKGELVAGIPSAAIGRAADAGIVAIRKIADLGAVDGYRDPAGAAAMAMVR